MKLLSRIITTLLLTILPLIVPLPAHAADFQTGDEIHIADSVQDLKDLYVTGGNITIDAPITNDLTIAGGELMINGSISNSLLAAGGNLTIKGAVGNNARIAGGNIIIDGPVANDLAITGGSVTITKKASIGGDVLFGGGKLTVNGPVQGKMMIGGGHVTINAPVNGDVTADVEELKLGSDANIRGKLSYTASEKAQIAEGAVVTGKTEYKPSERHPEDDAREFITTAAIYKLVSDILLSILFIYFFRRGLGVVLRRMESAAAISGGIGFAFFLLAPIAGLILLALLWLGIATWLFALLVTIIALFVLKIFLGWFIVRWWYTRQKHQYILDWKAGIIGPIILWLLLFIPVLGWLAAAVIFLIALGALLTELTNLASEKVMSPASSKKK